MLIICGVVLALLTTGLSIIGGIGAISVAPLYLLLVACVGLLGLGVALLSVSGPIFGGTLARWASRSAGLGLVGVSVILGLAALPDFQGSKGIGLYVSLFPVALVTIIGAVLTVLQLVAAGGRPRRVGTTFLVAVIAFFAMMWSVNNAASLGVGLLAIALSVLAGGALLLGFVGLALLGLDSAGTLERVLGRYIGDVGPGDAR